MRNFSERCFFDRGKWLVACLDGLSPSLLEDEGIIFFPVSLSCSGIIQGYKEVYLPVTLNCTFAICLGDVPFTCKNYITNTSLVITDSDHTYKHAVHLTQ